MARHYGVEGPRGGGVRESVADRLWPARRASRPCEHPAVELDGRGLAPCRERRLDPARIAGRPTCAAAPCRPEPRHWRRGTRPPTAEAPARAPSGQRRLRAVPPGNRSLGDPPGGVRRDRPAPPRLSRDGWASECCPTRLTLPQFFPTAAGWTGRRACRSTLWSTEAASSLGR